MTVVRKDLNGLSEQFQPDPLGLGVVNFPVIGWHLGPGAAVGEGHFLTAYAQRCTGGVNGRVASADYHHPLSQMYLLPQADGAQEGYTVEDAFHVLTRDPQLLGFVGADGQEDSRVSLVKQVINVPSGAVELELRP